MREHEPGNNPEAPNCPISIFVKWHEKPVERLVCADECGIVVEEVVVMPDENYDRCEGSQDIHSVKVAHFRDRRVVGGR
ncbi:hypothetical protein D3C72_2112700 [compost metagenome]